MTPSVFFEQFLAWSLAVNLLVLSVWFAAFRFAHDAIFRLHSRWFRLSVTQFDFINYAAMSAYKVGIILFNVAPLVALTILRTTGTT